MSFKQKQDYLYFLRKLKVDPLTSQRVLSKNLGISVGKLNYCLNALKKKGMIKIKNFTKNKDRFNPNSKFNYFYILTPKGIALKTNDSKFYEIKMKEYDELSKELNEK